MTIQELASITLILASHNIYDKATLEGQDGGSTAYMMEECCDLYNDVRLIVIDKSPLYGPKTKKQAILKFMKEYNITDEQVKNYKNDLSKKIL